MNTTEQDFDSGIEEKHPVDHLRKWAPEKHPTLYGRNRVKPDPETNPWVNLDWEKEPTHVEPPAEATRQEEYMCAEQ